MESRVIGYAHAGTAEPGEQAETHARFRDVIGLLAVNLHGAGEGPATAHAAGADSGGRAVLDAIVGLE